jgi:hypothetical protein
MYEMAEAEECLLGESNSRRDDRALSLSCLHPQNGNTANLAPSAPYLSGEFQKFVGRAHLVSWIYDCPGTSKAI